MTAGATDGPFIGAAVISVTPADQASATLVASGPADDRSYRLDVTPKARFGGTITIVYTPLFVRVMRAPVLAEREKEYIEAVRALGASRVVIAIKHLLPNVISPFVVQGTVAFSQAILIEASLSYLGLSAQPPTPSWGNMLNEGRTYLETAPWISVFPGIAIMVAVLAFNLIGDGVRDVLDPNA